jgi:thiol-disulfide isomerase/thioredoxin
VSPGLAVAVAAVVATLGFGLWRALTDGRFRGTHDIKEVGPSARLSLAEHAGRTDAPLAATPWAQALGQRATLLQFSSAFCAPCRMTRALLADIAESTPGVAHIEIDAEQNLPLVRQLSILRTPTTLVLDASGREVVRAAGAPRRDQVLRALESAGRAV